MSRKLSLIYTWFINVKFLSSLEGRGQTELKSNSGVNGYDLRWIMKLETKNLELLSKLFFTLEYSADARIIRKGLEEQIGAKYYKIRAEKKGMQMGSLFPLVSFWFCFNSLIYVFLYFTHILLRNNFIFLQIYSFKGFILYLVISFVLINCIVTIILILINCFSW